MTQLQPGLRTKIAEFSREASQLSREERPSAAREEQHRTQVVIAAARQDGYHAGKSAGWARGFFHGLWAAMAVAFILVVAFGMWR